MNHSQALKSALACALSIGMAGGASVAAAETTMPLPPHNIKMTREMSRRQQQKTMKYMKANDYVKCYGINAAYKNDCKSPGHSCAGQDSHARDPKAFVATPAGLCTVISGGSLTAGR